MSWVQFEWDYMIKKWGQNVSYIHIDIFHHIYNLKSIWDLWNLGKFRIGLGIGHFGGVFTQKPLVTVSDSCNIPLWIIRIFRLTKASPFFLSMTCKNCSFEQKLNSQPALKLSQPCIQTNNKIWVVYIKMASKTLF